MCACAYTYKHIACLWVWLHLPGLSWPRKLKRKNVQSDQFAKNFTLEKFLAIWYVCAVCVWWVCGIVWCVCMLVCACVCVWCVSMCGRWVWWRSVWKMCGVCVICACMHDYIGVIVQGCVCVLYLCMHIHMLYMCTCVHFTLHPQNIFS